LRFAIIILGLLLVSCSAPIAPELAEPTREPLPTAVPAVVAQSTVQPTRRGPTEGDFEIVTYRVEDDPPATRIIGEIRNKGSVPAGVELEAVARDASGTIIDDVRFWASGATNIPPGAIQPFAATGPRVGTRGVELRPISVRVW
jgi:hypothetical protein